MMTTSRMTASDMALIVPVFALALAAGAAGVFELARVVQSPAVTVEPLPQVTRPAPIAVSAMSTDAPIWPALFGTVAPEAMSAPEPDLPPDPEDYSVADYSDDDPIFDPDRYVLRGLVLQDGAGWAMVETDGQVSIIRVGDILADGEEVLALTEQGMELDFYGDLVVVELAQASSSPRPVQALDPQRGSQSLSAQEQGGGYQDDDGYYYEDGQSLDEVFDADAMDGSFSQQMGIGR